MAGTDSFNASNQPKRGANPFADKSYSDSFVRATTAPLGKRMTRPLQANSEMVSDKLRGVEEQIGLCRTIIERFAQRMKILKTAETLLRHGAVPEPEPAPEPEPQVPKTPFGKPGLGKKPFGKPAAPKPAAKAAPMPAAPGLGAQEKAMAAAIADRLRQDADLLRRAQIALFQFEDAERSVLETAKSVEPIRLADPEQAWDLIEALEVSKLQGKVYPICNFHEIFKRDPILSRVFPPPVAAGAPMPPGPAGPGGAPAAMPPSPGTGPLGTGPLGRLDNLKGFFKK